MDTRTSSNTKSLVLCALFIALSLVGSYIKVFGSVAFDSFPGFLAALLLGPVYGAAIGLLGHLFTAMTSGFPLSVPIHMVVAISMAITMYGFGLTHNLLKNRVPVTVNFLITGIVGVILNGPVSLALSMGTLMIMAGKEVALGLLALLPALMFASVANVVLALLVYKALEKPWNKGFNKAQ